MNRSAHADIALLAPISGIFAVFGTVLMAAGSWVQWFGVLLLLASPVAQATWATRARPVRRAQAVTLAFVVSVAATVLSLFLVWLLTRGDDAVGMNVAAVLLAVPLLLLVVGTAAGLLRARCRVFAAGVAWAALLAVSAFAQNMALYMTDTFGNDAMAALVILVAPIMALCAWAGVVVAIRVSAAGRKRRSSRHATKETS